MTNRPTRNATWMKLMTRCKLALVYDNLASYCIPPSCALDPSGKHTHTCMHAHTHTPTHMGSGDSSVVLQIHLANTHTHTHARMHAHTLPHTWGVGTAQWCFRSIMQTRTHTRTHTHTHSHTHGEWCFRSIMQIHTHNIWGAGTAQ